MIGIYKITNKQTGKAYIGQSVNIYKRWADHRASTKDYPLYNDFRKYGINNFIFEVLEECSMIELNEKEQYWIEYYDTYYNGYNQTPGGNSTPNPLHLDYEAIYQRFLETDSMSQTAKDFNCSVTPIRNALRAYGIDNSNKEKEKAIEQIDPQTLQVITVFPSIAEAAKAMNINYTAITQAANGIHLSSCGYFWRFVGDNKTFSKKSIKKWKRNIIQCNLETGEEIAEFPSAAAAARSLGKDGKNGASSIISACKGTYKSAFGYKWKYKDQT